MLRLDLIVEDLLLVIDRVPTELADGLAAAVNTHWCGETASLRLRLGHGSWQSIRPGRVEDLITRQRVPRSLPHRAGAIRQVDLRPA
jgi:hypothetical protein